MKKSLIKKILISLIILCYGIISFSNSIDEYYKDTVEESIKAKTILVTDEDGLVHTTGIVSSEHGPGVDSAPGQAQNQFSIGDINPGQGTVFFSEIDLGLPGKGNLNLQIARSYNSQMYRSTANTGLKDSNPWGGWVGQGWSFSFAMRAYVVQCTDGTYNKIVIDNSGVLETYTYNSNSGKYTSTVSGNFTKADFNGNAITLQLPNGSKYCFTQEFYSEEHNANDNSWQLKITGYYLTEIKDLYNNLMSIAYSYLNKETYNVGKDEKIYHIIGDSYGYLNGKTAFSSSATHRVYRPLSMIDTFGRNVSFYYEETRNQYSGAAKSVMITSIRYNNDNGTYNEIKYSYNINGLLSSVQHGNLPAKIYEYKKHIPEFVNHRRDYRYDYPNYESSSVLYFQNGYVNFIEYPDQQNENRLFITQEKITINSLSRVQNEFVPMDINALWNELINNKYISSDGTILDKTKNTSSITDYMDINWCAVNQFYCPNRSREVINILRRIPDLKYVNTIPNVYYFNNNIYHLKYSSTSIVSEYTGYILNKIINPLGSMVEYEYEDSMETVIVQSFNYQANVFYEVQRPIPYATYPVVIKKTTKIDTYDSDEFVYTINYPRENGHVKKTKYRPPNSNGDAYYFPWIEIDNPDTILEDRRFEFKNGLPVLQKNGMTSTIISWNFETKRQIYLESRLNDVVQSRQEFISYDEYNNPLQIKTYKGQDIYMTQTFSYYTDSIYINNNLLSLLKRSTTTPANHGEYPRGSYVTYTDTGAINRTYKAVNGVDMEVGSKSYYSDGRIQSETIVGDSSHNIPNKTVNYTYNEGTDYSVTKKINNSDSKKMVQVYLWNSGKIKSSTDMNGGITRFNYLDDYGLHTETVYPNNSKTITEYADDLKSVSKKISDGTNVYRTVTSYLDNYGRPIFVDNPGNEDDVGYTYYYGDKKKNVYKGSRLSFTSYSSAGKLMETYKYDTYLRPIKKESTYWGTIISSYDDDYHQVTVTDAKGRSVTKTSDLLGKMILQKNIVDDSTTHFSYDSYGNSTQVIDQKNILHKSNYDTLGRLISTCHPNSTEEWSLNHYSENDVLLGTDIKDTSGYIFRNYDYGYDAEGRLINTKLDGTIVEILSYDEIGTNHLKGIGALTTAQNDSAKSEYAYDNMASLKQEVRTYKNLNQEFKLINQFNNKNQLTEFDYNNSAGNNLYKLKYVYDDEERLQSIKYKDTTILTYAYSNNGTIAYLDYGNGYRVSYNYEKEVLVKGIEVRQGDILIYNSDQTYDTIGNMTSQKHTDILTQAIPQTNMELSYTYNDRDELATVKINDQENYYTFAYDKNSNRTKFTNPVEGNSPEFTINDYDQIVERTSVFGKYTFEYDPAGNMTHKKMFHEDNSTPFKTLEYKYNYQDQISSVLIDGVEVANYEYDTSRQRIFKNENYAGIKERKLYHWDNSGHIIGESNINDDNTVNADWEVVYIYNGNEKVAMVRNGKTYYFINNLQGTPVIIADINGAIVQKMQYDSYGNLEQLLGEFGDEINYTGKKLDKITGLYYFNQRYYDPELGRFLTHDPAGQAMNPYLYAGNNPLMYIDPDGEFWNFIVAAFWTGAAAAGGNFVWQTANNLFENGLNFSNWSYDTQSIANAFSSGALMGGLNMAFNGVVNFGSGWGMDALETGISYGFSNVSYAGIMGEDISGSNFYSKFWGGFNSGFTSSLATSLYENQVGYEADVSPGNGIIKNRPAGVNAIEGKNVWGNPVNQVVDFFKSPAEWLFTEIFPGKEGGPLSVVANFIPGQNAFAHLHDNWCPNLLTSLIAVPLAQYMTYHAVKTKIKKAW